MERLGRHLQDPCRRPLRTGDLASRDSAERFRLTERIKEVSIHGGYNVDPMGVESVLCQHPGAAEIIIVPLPDDVMVEVVVAVVVTASDTTGPTLEELREFGAVYLSRYKLPKRLLTITSMPSNASDKIDRRAVRESLATPSP